MLKLLKILNQKQNIHNEEFSNNPNILGEYKNTLFNFFGSKFIPTKIKKNLAYILYDFYGKDPYLCSRGELPFPKALDYLPDEDYKKAALGSIKEQGKSVIEYERDNRERNEANLPRNKLLLSKLLLSKDYNKEFQIISYLYENKESLTNPSEKENHGKALFALISDGISDHSKLSRIHNNIFTTFQKLPDSGTLNNNDLEKLYVSISKHSNIIQIIRNIPRSKIAVSAVLVWGISSQVSKYTSGESQETIDTSFFTEKDKNKQIYLNNEERRNTVVACIDTIYKLKLNYDLNLIGEESFKDFTLSEIVKVGLSDTTGIAKDKGNPVWERHKKNLNNTLMFKDAIPISLEEMKENRLENNTKFFSLMDKDSQGNYICVLPNGNKITIRNKEKQDIMNWISQANLSQLDTMISDINKVSGSEDYDFKSRSLVNNFISYPSPTSVNQKIGHNNTVIYINHNLKGDYFYKTVLHELLHSYNRVSKFVIATEGKTDLMALGTLYTHTGKDLFGGYHKISKEPISNYANITIAALLTEELIPHIDDNFAFKRYEGYKNRKSADNFSGQDNVTIMESTLFNYLKDNPYNDIDPKYLLCFFHKNQRAGLLKRISLQLKEDKDNHKKTLTELIKYIPDKPDAITYFTPRILKDIQAFYDDPHIKKLCDDIDKMMDIDASGTVRFKNNDELKAYYDKEVLPHMFGGKIDVKTEVPSGGYIDPEVLDELLDSSILKNLNSIATPSLNEAIDFLSKYLYLLPCFILLICLIARLRRLQYIFSKKNEFLDDYVKDKIQIIKQRKMLNILIIAGIVACFQYKEYSETSSQFQKLFGSLETILELKEKALASDEKVKSNSSEIGGEIFKVNTKDIYIKNTSLVLFIVLIVFLYATHRKYSSKEYLSHYLQPKLKDGEITIQRGAIHRLFIDANQKEFTGLLDQLSESLIHNYHKNKNPKTRNTTSYADEIQKTKERGEYNKDRFIQSIMDYYYQLQDKNNSKKISKITETEYYELPYDTYRQNPGQYKLSKHRKNNDPESKNVICTREKILKNNTKESHSTLQITITDPYYKQYHLGKPGNIEKSMKTLFYEYILIISYLQNVSKNNKIFEVETLFSENYGIDLKSIKTLTINKNTNTSDIRSTLEILFDEILSFPIFNEGRINGRTTYPIEGNITINNKEQKSFMGMRELMTILKHK